MEAAAASVAAAARGVSIPMPSSQPSRKEWRIVPEQSVRNLTSEDLERSKIGQSDERTIYEVQQGREPADVDFCSITIDGGSENDVLQHRLHNVARQREELQHMEVDLRAQIIARSEMIQMQTTFDSQIKEQSSTNVKLQEQLHEMEQKVRELEKKMEEKDRELHAIKLDTEAAWAKEDLLREQSKELQTYRRERDNSEAEKVQHVKQIHDFQEHIQEKDRQFLELQEQHRVAQETIIYRDEQLREAQGWIARFQEMDTLQSTTNLYTLQAELRERTEQYHQLWIGCQRQFAEMERLHAHTIQQLQLELADSRERSGTYPDETHISQTNSKDSSQFGQNNGNQLDVNGSIMPSTNSGGLPTGNSENVSSLVSTGNASTEANHVHGVAISPASLLGMPTYLPPGQMTALHPFVIHQQGVSHSVPSHVAQSHVGQFHSVPLQHWQNQQASPDGPQVPTHNQYPPSQTDRSLLRSDNNYDYEVSANGQAIHSEYLDIHSSQGMEPDTVIRPTSDEGQVDKSYMVAPQPQQSLQHVSSQFHDALRLETLSQNGETKEKSITASTNHGLEGQGFTTEQESSAKTPLTPLSETSINHVDLSEATMNNPSGGILSEAFVSSGPKNEPTAGTASEIVLLDERSLLACVARTIPPGSGGRIRISSTLPNRLGKMLAPLHWHDYKKKYGKLDDFVAGHPELFLIEGDFIQLRDGAQEIIAATAAVAKIAAAAKNVPPPYASRLPSVAVTPMAQSHRPKRVPSAADNPSQLSLPNQHSNGVGPGAGSMNFRILSKPKDQLEANGNESRPGQSSVLVGNGTSHDRSGLGSSMSKGSGHARPSANLVGKQQGRY